MTTQLTITCEHPFFNIADTTNDFNQIAPCYDYGIINFIRPINKLRVTTSENDNEPLFSILSGLSKQIDDLFGEIEQTKKLNIPSGLHSILDKVAESQSNNPIIPDVISWANKIANEHFSD